MPECTPDALLALSNCYSAVPTDRLQLVKLALYCRWANGISTPCDIQTLLNEAACFWKYSSIQRRIAGIVLLCSIMNNPPTPPPAPNIVADLWQTFEFDAAANTMTPAQLLASDHNGTGTWFIVLNSSASSRSEERRVGKECRL